MTAISPCKIMESGSFSDLLERVQAALALNVPHQA